MGQYLIDNNVISDYFTGQLSEQAMNFVSDVIDRTPNISVITAIEALSWQSSEKKYEAIIKEFVDNSNIFDLSRKTVARCVQIRRSKKIKTPDAIIAATAIVHCLTLITSDNDFNNIPELALINPTNLPDTL
ncbi:MAG: type II toxin-antitoxin system VapC family toxin [Prevotellaceae bacterium]|jgi:predicted nucleic acid-binding protein|nr:type II toxin-antitoxin system VapC family toxin [Prevotellaceae bacterium]